MANLAQMVNVLQAVILTDEEKMIKTPTYHVMNMYKVHQDAMLLPSKIENNFQFRGLPAISVSASKGVDDTVHISLVNIDSKEQRTVEVNVADLDIKNLTAQILTSEKLQDHNSFNDPEKVVPGEFKDFKLRKGVLSIDIPAHSLIVLEGK
jgi:alpha-N-arabinofuranosidase